MIKGNRNNLCPQIIMNTATFSTNRPINRRMLLRGIGTSMSLPILEAMVPSTVLAQSVAPAIPPRMAFLAYGIGMNMRQFYPEGEGRTARMSRILAPLEPFRDHMTAFSGTAQENGGSHQGDYVILTAGEGKTPTGIKNNISADQVAAEHLGQNTRFPLAAVFHQARHRLRRGDEYTVVE